jgi:hypothetical protein
LNRNEKLSSKKTKRRRRGLLPRRLNCTTMIKRVARLRTTCYGDF